MDAATGQSSRIFSYAGFLRRDVGKSSLQGQAICDGNQGSSAPATAVEARPCVSGWRLAGPAAMFSPEMLKAAQGMMANMSPEDMQRMTQMAANMDPSVMEGMMKNMGGNAPAMDSSQMQEQMMPSMSQAQQQMGGQKQYMYNASMQLKNEGNDHIKAQKYSDALRAYSKALENLKPFAGDDISQLRLSLMLNSAMCHLKQSDPARCVEVCEEALQINSHSVKALFRRGLARVDLGQLAEGVADIKFAAKLRDGCNGVLQDKTIASELQRVEKDCMGKGVSSEAIETAQQKAEEAAKKGSGSVAASAGASAPSSGLPGAGGQNVGQAMEQISKNPEMDIERMMASAPLPPGVDKETARKRMEAVSKNPEMLKTAMDTLSSMPEEERKRMLQSAAGGGAAPDFSKMGDPWLQRQRQPWAGPRRVR
eukprot:s5291_g8.t1